MKNVLKKLNEHALRTEERRLNKKLYERWNMFHCHSSNEVEYLLSGQATELISTTSICFWEGRQDEDFNRSWPDAELYGVIAAKREANRYLWFYLRHGQKLWKCNDIRQAMELICDLTEYSRIEWEIEEKSEWKIAQELQNQKETRKITKSKKAA